MSLSDITMIIGALNCDFLSRLTIFAAGTVIVFTMIMLIFVGLTKRDR